MSNLEPKNYPAVVIGAGPVGLFAIFELGMLKISCAVIDTLEVVGGQCQALYPEKPIYDIPAYPKILASELITQLEAQAAPFHPSYYLGQQVVKLVRLENEEYQLTTNTGTIINTKVVIIAGGCGAFGPNRPPLAGLEHYEDSKAVRYMVNRMEDFRGKKLVIAGGGDSAVDWAVNLAHIAEKIYVVHRRDKFRAAPETISQMKELAHTGKVELVTPYQLHSLEGDGTKLHSVVVSDLDGNHKHLEADYLLPFFGLAMELGPIADWGLNLHRSTIEVAQGTMATNLPGIYAIGDIAHYHHKLKLILTGFAEAASAAHQAYHLIYPDTPLHFEYSTTKGVA